MQAETEAAQQARRRRGLLIAVVGSASVATSFVTAKYAMQALDPLTFVFLWFTCAWSCASLFMLARRVGLVQPLRGYWKPLLGIGLLHCASVVSGFTGLKMLDPTVTSFLSRSEVLFAALLGLIVLRERPGRDAWLGMGLAVAGIVILSYATGAGERLGVVLCLVSAVTAALGYMVGKYVAGLSSPAVTVWCRSAVIAATVLPVAMVTGSFHVVPSWSHLVVLAAGAAVGPFGAQLLFFHSLRYISLSEVGVVRTTSPLFVAIYAPLFLGMFPTLRQFVGGAIVILGLLVLAWARPVGEQALARSVALMSTDPTGPGGE